MSKSTVVPAEVLANLQTEEGKAGGFYVIAHQGEDVMTVIVKDNVLVQIPLHTGEEVQGNGSNASTPTPHPIGTKVWFSAEGKLLDVQIPRFAQPKASKAQGCDTPRKQA
jgi:hypothetical protein